MVLCEQGEDEGCGTGGQVVDCVEGERADNDCEEEGGEEGG